MNIRFLVGLISLAGFVLGESSLATRAYLVAKSAPGH